MALFIRHNVPSMSKWNYHRLLQWIGFCSEQGFILPISSTLHSPQLDGLVIARPVMNVQQMTDCYAFDPEGRFIYVDVAIAKTPDMLAGIAITVRQRFGLREGVFWHRERNKTLRGYGARKLLSHLLIHHVATSRT